MKAIAKNIGKFNQFVGERFAHVSKHDLPEDFVRLEAQTEIRKEGSDSILEACTTYLKTLDKKKDGTDRQKKLPIELLGDALQEFGSDLNEASEYGQALLKLGQTEHELGQIQLTFSNKIKDGLVSYLEEYHQEMKNWKHLRAKLENRRLDYDAKVNKIQKSKREKPDLDEEMRQAQTKYEETLHETEQVMIHLNDKEEPQLNAILSFLEAQYEYHQKSLEVLSRCKQVVRDSNVTGTRLYKSKLPLSQSQLSLQDEGMNQLNKNISQSQPVLSSQIEKPQIQIQQLGSHGNFIPVSRDTSSVTQSSNRLTAQASSVITSHTPHFNTPEPSFLHMDATPSQASSRPISQQPLEQKVKKLVRANYSFTAENKNELSLEKGDVVTVLHEVDEGWWIGEKNQERGLFPANYCQVVEQSEIKPKAGQPENSQQQQTQQQQQQQLAVPTESQLKQQTAPQPIPAPVPRSQVVSNAPSFTTAPQGPTPAQTQQPSMNSIRGFSYFSSQELVNKSPPTPPRRKQQQRTPESSMSLLAREDSSDNLLGLQKIPEQQQDIRTSTNTGCVECGCKEYNENPFKPGQCCNCFHLHKIPSQ